jgi:type IV secretion system protein VirB11
MLDELSENKKRLYQKLHMDLGEMINNALQEPSVKEIILNPDGSLWVDDLMQGLQQVGIMSHEQAYNIIHTVAGIRDKTIHSKQPRLEAEFPRAKGLNGERFTAQVPPVVSAPAFTIRKPARDIFTLEKYVASNLLSIDKYAALQNLIIERKNILIAGGPGSGKTTFVNALIAKAAAYYPQERFVILQDLSELQCTARNTLCLFTTSDIDMDALLRTSLRMRPDRILVGEVRGAEALSLLKAWNTGCPGGFCTVHANGAKEALQRIVDLTLESGLSHAPISLILQTVHAVVSVTRQEQQQGFISEVLLVEGYESGKFFFKELA